MIRSSNDRRRHIEALSTMIPAAQTMTHAVDEAAAARLGINRTDLRCLGVLLECGPLPAGKLAESVGLTRGAMTTALDRVEQAGFVRRVHNDQDRRGVTIEVTQAAKDAIAKIWGPIRVDGLAVLKKYSTAELGVLQRFFKDYCEIQQANAVRIRKLGKPDR